MSIELQIRAAEERLHAALVRGQDTTPLRAELDRLRAVLAQQQAVAAQVAAASACATREAVEASIQHAAACIAAEAAGRLKALLTPFSIEDSQHD